MTQFGYTAMGEQTPARQMVKDLVAAELAGFDFSVTSDHYGAEHQDDFIGWAGSELLPALRELG